jgi:hypothetical protein
MMLGLFRPKVPIDGDELEWLIACYAWMAREFGGIARLLGTALVLPSTEFFPPSDLTGHPRALELFGQVKALCGMAEWQCDLVAGAADRESSVGPAQLLRHHAKPQPAGTFGYHAGRYFVTYNPSTLKEPQAFVAMLSHELGHYLIHSAQSRPPGGAELEEHATDLASIFLGFGIFSANSAKNFRQHQDFEVQGWQMQSLGYLSELARVTALALFVCLARSDAKAAEAGLKDYLRGPFRKALSAIDRMHPDLAAALEQVDLMEWR